MGKVLAMSLKSSFFNTFLPGGVVGDVYRFWSFPKSDRVKVGWTVWVDRWAGLLGLVLCVCLLTPPVALRQAMGPWAWLAVLAVIALAVVTGFAQKRFAPGMKFRHWIRPVIWSALGHSSVCTALALALSEHPLEGFRLIPLMLLASSVPLLPAGVGTGHWIAVYLLAWVGPCS
jgi:hypothetical protein